MIALVRDRPLMTKPGSVWAMSQSDYVLLGMVIEHVSGKSFATFMQEQIFTPLKLLPDTGMEIA
jgi:CubicO group peptidase (beta-lactamase class C family)